MQERNVEEACLSYVDIDYMKVEWSWIKTHVG